MLLEEPFRQSLSLSITKHSLPLLLQPINPSPLSFTGASSPFQTTPVLLSPTCGVRSTETRVKGAKTRSSNRNEKLTSYLPQHPHMARAPAFQQQQQQQTRQASVKACWQKERDPQVCWNLLSSACMQACYSVPLCIRAHLDVRACGC